MMHGRIDIKDIEVSDDYLTLDAICEDHGLTPKTLALMVGRAKATVYRYLNGEATIPSFVWRVLYEKTRDVRIQSLFTGIVPVVVVDLTVDSPRGIPAMAELVKMRTKQIGCEKNILDILADGVIDAKDRPALRRLKKDFSEMLRTQSQIYYALTREFERSVP